MTSNKQSQRIYLSPPHLCGKEIEFVNEAFTSNWIAPLGPYVDAFERSICDYLHIDHCAALSSGTAALHLALILLGVERDDYVICPSFTFSASANPIIYQHAKPVFIDSESETWNMDPQLLEDGIRFCLSENKKPKAIIVVHLYGMPAKLDEILSIAQRYEIPVIEDAAESLGSTYHQIPTGTFGDLAVLSFNGNKIITTSGGGALVSKNESFIKRAKFLGTQARDKAPHYEHSVIGYNYRLSNICAAIGCGQMTVLDERINQRRNNFQSYKLLLSKVPGIKFIDEPPGMMSNRWLTTCLIDPGIAGTTNSAIAQALELQNIESRPLWKPMHLQPVFKNSASFLNGNSAACFEQGICLPSGSALTDAQIEQICSIILSTLHH